MVAAADLQRYPPLPTGLSGTHNPYRPIGGEISLCFDRGRFPFAGSLT
jgi:hypothetical protein